MLITVSVSGISLMSHSFESSSMTVVVSPAVQKKASMTEDQILAIEATKTDMQSHKIMDRLICGDVGYGKTEVENMKL